MQGLRNRPSCRIQRRYWRDQHFYELKQCQKYNKIQNGSCEPTFMSFVRFFFLTLVSTSAICFSTMFVHVLCFSSTSPSPCIFLLICFSFNRCSNLWYPFLVTFFLPCIWCIVNSGNKAQGLYCFKRILSELMLVEFIYGGPVLEKKLHLQKAYPLRKKQLFHVMLCPT